MTSVFARTIALVVSALLVAPSAGIQAGEYWEVDTRGAPRCAPGDQGTQRIVYRRCDTGRWMTSDRQTLLSAAVDHPLLIFVHGNWSTATDARRAGASLRAILRGGADEQPHVMALWSWPSARVQRRPRPDIRRNARYSDTQAFYLADFLSRVEAATPVTLVGYSFGARAICGALEMMAGGRVAGMALRTPAPPRAAPVNVVLAAAAMPAHWLGPGRRHGQSLHVADHMTITVNRCDRVLRHYPRLDGCQRGPEALGFVGPTCLDRASAERLVLLPVACSIGSKHAWSNYLRSGSLRRAILDATFARPDDRRRQRGSSKP